MFIAFMAELTRSYFLGVRYDGKFWEIGGLQIGNLLTKKVDTGVKP